MRPLFFRALKAQLVFLITSLLLFTVGCEDDDHDDHEGEEEEESTLSITENDATIAIVEVEEHHEESGSEEHHDEMGIEVIGVSAGTTNFKLRLMHGDHADYTSVNNVKVTVTAAAN